MDNIKELLVRLEKAQREYPETHVLLGQTRTAVVALQAKVEELTKPVEDAEVQYSMDIAYEEAAAFREAGILKTADEFEKLGNRIYRLAREKAELQAKVEEFKGVFERQQLLIAEGMNYTTDLQAKVDRLETKVKALVRVAQDSSYGRHYLRTHYPALKQEKSDE